MQLGRQRALLDAVTFHALAIHLARATDSGSFFTRALFRRLFIMSAQFHFAVNAFALQLFLQRAQRLIDIIIANDDLHKLVTLRQNFGKVVHRTTKPDA